METRELEQLRRSVAMISESHSGWALTKPRAQELLDELDRLSVENDRYRRVVAELKRVVEGLDLPAR